MSARPPLSASVEPAAADFTTRLAQRAARLTLAHARARTRAQANAHTRNDAASRAARWRDAALLWPLFTED